MDPNLSVYFGFTLAGREMILSGSVVSPQSVLESFPLS